MKRRLIVWSLLFILVTSSGVGCESSSNNQSNPAEGLRVATVSGSTNPQIPTIVPEIAITQDLGPMILMQDDFSDPTSGWEEYDGTSGRATYTSGGYLVETAEEEKVMWGLANKNYSDIRIDVDATVLTGPKNGNNGYGVDCRVQSNDEGYSFYISSDGYFEIMKYQNEEYQHLFDWKTSDAINKGNITNHLTVICQGSHLSLMVNDVLLAEVIDHSFSAGDISLSAISYEDDQTSVLFDNIIVQELGNPYIYEDQGHYSVTIENPTMYEACILYITTPENDSWGDNLLAEGDTLKPGESITIKDLTQSIVDVKVDTCQFLRLIEAYDVNLLSVSSLSLETPKLFQENEFFNLNGWTSGVVDGGTISQSNGDYYTLSVPQAEKLVVGVTNYYDGDITIHADASMVKTGQDDMGIYGVACRVQPNGDGILFAIRGDGSVSIQKMDNGKLETLDLPPFFVPLNKLVLGTSWRAESRQLAV